VEKVIAPEAEEIEPIENLKIPSEQEERISEEQEIEEEITVYEETADKESMGIEEEEIEEDVAPKDFERGP
jgi:hypothetical protein